MPCPVTTHSRLGDLFARFDMQMYAVKFERHTLKTIGTALGLCGGEEENIERILEIAKDYRINADSTALDSWWVKSLCEFWGSGKHDDDTRRAAKVACHMAAQVHARNSTANIHIGSDFDEFLKGQGIHDEVTQAAAASLEDWLRSEYGLPIEAAGKASFGLDTVRRAFELGQASAAKASALPSLTEAQRQAISLAKSFMPNNTKDRSNAHVVIDAVLSAKPVECAARKQGTAGGNDPAECDWPACDCDPIAGKVIESLLDQHNLATTFAQRDVLKERAEQCTREGFTPAHDDEKDAGVISAAGAAYALAAADFLYPASMGDGSFHTTPPNFWPFHLKWWKPVTPRRALVKAAAMLIAEIEKLDRNAFKSQEVSNG